MKVGQLILLAMLALSSYAQKGDFLLKHHDLRHPNLDNSNFEIISDQNGLICLANRAGVLKYDGDTWDFYQTPSAALSLAIDKANTLYVGSVGSVGKIDLNENKISFQSLLETDTISDLFLQVSHVNDKVYFLGNHNFFIYDPATENLVAHKGDFINMYEIEGELFVNTIEDTYKTVEDSLVAFKSKIRVSAAHKIDKRPTMLVDFDGELFVWEDRAKRITHNKVLEENGYEVVDARWINDSLFVCSTFSSGAIFLNYYDDKFIEVTDYHTGLPDNEIYAIHADQSGSVWIAHPFGLTSVSPLFPAFSYSNFPGLKGNLTGVFQEDEKLWVSSSLGLFHFDRDTTYKNQVYYVQVSGKQSNQTQVQDTKTNTKKASRKFRKKKRNRAVAGDDKKKKGLLGKLFDNPDNVSRISGKQAKNAKYARRVRKVPVKINYKFSQVDGTDGKFIDMVTYGSHLLAVSTSGIYEISSNGSELILEENVRSVSTTSTGQLIVSTSDFELKSFALSDNIWIEQATEHLDDIVVGIKEDSNGKIWLAGSSNVYNISVTDSSLIVDNAYELSNQFLDDVNILERNDTLYFINSQGYFYYDQENDRLAENTSLKSQLGPATTSIIEPSGQAVWIKNEKNWHSIPARGEIREFKYLGLFKDLISISKDGNSDEYWLLTRDNQLLKYNPAKSKELDSHELFVKNLSNQNGDIDKSKSFSLSYDETFLTVELSKPDFLGLLNPEFQYKLDGLHEEWSEWTKSKSIDFSYLPAGKYALLVRSKDTFGRIEESSMLQFSVKSPYWQRPWFYALQILFFGALVLISSRLNQSKTQNRLLSGALSVLTLVLIIEFIQSGAGALLNIQSTPVVDFLVDVFVAFLIFPLENFLRKLLAHGEHGEKLMAKKEQLASGKS